MSRCNFDGWDDVIGEVPCKHGRTESAEQQTFSHLLNVGLCRNVRRNTSHGANRFLPHRNLVRHGHVQSSWARMAKYLSLTCTCMVCLKCMRCTLNTSAITTPIKISVQQAHATK